MEEQPKKSPKKLFIIGFIVLVVIALPILLLQLRKSQDTRSGASAGSVTYSYVEPSKNIATDQDFTVDVVVDTGGMSVEGMDFSVSYPSTTTTFVSFTPVSTVSSIPGIPAPADNGGLKYFRFAGYTASTDAISGTNKKIGTLKFHVKPTATSGTVQLAFSNGKASNPTNATIPTIFAAQGNYTIGNTNPVNFFFESTSSSVVPQNNFTVLVKANTGGSNVEAVDFTITYPHDKVQFISFQPVSKVSAISLGSGTNLAGSYRFLGNTASSAPITGASDTIGTITFKALTPGTGALAFSQTKAGNPQNPALTTTSGTYSINVSSPNGTTPTVSPTVNLTPTTSPTVRISGMHVNSAGAPFSLSGQSIQITNLSTNVSQTTQARPNWSFDNLPRANYRVTATNISGYTTKTSVCHNCTFHESYTAGNSIDIEFVNNNIYYYSDVNTQYIQNTTTVTPSPSPTPTVTPSPSPTFSAGDTGLRVSFYLPGIGLTSGDNGSPVRTNRPATVAIYNASNTQVGSAKTGNVTYQASTGKYEGTINLGTGWTTGSYTVKLKVDNSLYKRIPGIITITFGSTTNTTTAVQLVTGDINQDNVLSVEDYSAVVACYQNKTGCTTAIRPLADVNDNGKTTDDLDDFAIMQRGFAIRNGD